MMDCTVGLHCINARLWSHSFPVAWWNKLQADINVLIISAQPTAFLLDLKTSVYTVGVDRDWDPVGHKKKVDVLTLLNFKLTIIKF